MKHVRRMHLHDQPFETPGSNIGQTELGEWVQVVDYQELVLAKARILRLENALQDIADCELGRLGQEDCSEWAEDIAERALKTTD